MFFKNEYFFLSNFYPCMIYDYRVSKYAPSVEHYFQAQKTVHKSEIEMILNAKTASDAKKLGRKVSLREDWEDIKDAVMLEGLRQKFAYPHLRNKLLHTKDIELVENNNWNDTYWGVCNGVGKNMLGKLLMQVREEIKNDEFK